MKSIEWIDKVEKHLGGISDYKVAQVLGMSKSAISKHRTGGAVTLDDDACLAVAEALDINPAVVFLDQYEERAKNPKIRKMWAQVARTAKKAAGSAALFAVCTSATMFSAEKTVAYEASINDRLYIMRNCGF